MALAPGEGQLAVRGGEVKGKGHLQGLEAWAWREEELEADRQQAEEVRQHQPDGPLLSKKQAFLPHIQGPHSRAPPQARHRAGCTTGSPARTSLCSPAKAAGLGGVEGSGTHASLPTCEANFFSVCNGMRLT